MSLSATKDQIRKHWLSVRQSIPRDQKFIFNEALTKNTAFFWHEAGLSKNDSNTLWVSFKSFCGEPDLEQTHQNIPARFVFPRVISETEMEFREPAKQEPRFLKGSLGSWEPDPLTSEVRDLKQCLGVFVPGVSFDRSGTRLGLGKGYYDRALSDFKGLKVGICFSTQVSETQLPRQTTDVVMDALVTDKEVLFFRRSNQ